MVLGKPVFLSTPESQSWLELWNVWWGYVNTDQPSLPPKGAGCSLINSTAVVLSWGPLLLISHTRHQSATWQAWHHGDLTSSACWGEKLCYTLVWALYAGYKYWVLMMAVDDILQHSNPPPSMRNCQPARYSNAHAVMGFWQRPISAIVGSQSINVAAFTDRPKPRLNECWSWKPMRYLAFALQTNEFIYIYIYIYIVASGLNLDCDILVRPGSQSQLNLVCTQISNYPFMKISRMNGKSIDYFHNFMGLTHAAVTYAAIYMEVPNSVNRQSRLLIHIKRELGLWWCNWKAGQPGPDVTSAVWTLAMQLFHLKAAIPSVLDLCLQEMFRWNFGSNSFLYAVHTPQYYSLQEQSGP